MTSGIRSDGRSAGPGCCPVCGGGNGCAAVAGADRCWCAEVTIDGEVERWLAAQAIADRCLCRQCATGAVPSPCISVCELDRNGEHCLGCNRTLNEIGGWATFSVAQKATAWRRLRDAKAGQ